MRRLSRAGASDWAKDRQFLRTVDLERERLRAERLDGFTELFAWTHEHFAPGPSQNVREIADFVEYASGHPIDVVCEIGVQDGGNTMLLAHGLPEVRVLVAVDLLVRNRKRVRSMLRPDQEYHAVSGPSYGRKTFQAVSRALAGRPVDLLFIDGDHTAEGVTRDFLCYRELVRPGGIIAFHDIHTASMSAPNGDVGDVPAVWARLADLVPATTFEHARDQDGQGIGVISHDPTLDIAPVIAALPQ